MKVQYLLPSFSLLHLLLIHGYGKEVLGSDRIEGFPVQLLDVVDANGTSISISSLSKKLKCGTIHDYWTNTCGHIFSPESRTCTHGGVLVNPSACNTHFEEHSRGCSFLFLGCQSLCRIHARPCDTGAVHFVSSFFSVKKQDTFKVRLMRSYGFDSEVTIEVELCEGTDRQTQSVTWVNRNSDIIPVEFKSQGDKVDYQVCIKQVENVEIASPFKADVFLYEYLEHDIQFEKKEILVSVSKEKCSLNLRYRNKKDESITVRLHNLGGTAAPDADYINIFPMDVTWKPSDGEIKTVDVPILDNILQTNITVIVGMYLGETKKLLSLTQIMIAPTQENENWNIELELENLFNLINAKTHAVRHFLSNSLRPIRYSAKSALQSNDTNTELLYIVEEGIVEMSLKTSVILDKGMNMNLEKGSMFGFLKDAKVKAITHCKLWIMPAQALFRFQILDPENYEDFIGEMMKLTVSSFSKKPPLLFFPGFMSSRLVSWQAKECSGLDIGVRDVIWFSVEKLMQTMVSDAKCWLSCLSLDELQSDPPDCTLRPMDGIDALTELAPGVFTSGITTIFGNLLNQFASVLRYTSTNLVAVPYDWRLSPSKLESRDGFFSKLKKTVEGAKETSGFRCIAIGHSQGNVVFLHFLRYLEHKMGKSKSEAWIDRHFIGYFGVAAPLLGAFEPVQGVTVGNNLGLPFPKSEAKRMALTFGSLGWFLPNNGIPKWKKSTAIRRANTWKGSISNITFPNGTKTSFFASEFADGSYFKTVSEALGDQGMMHFYDMIQEDYWHQDYAQLADGYDVPKIKNINMFYTINVKTPSAQSYTLIPGMDPLPSETHFETNGGIIHDQLGRFVDTNGFGKSGDGTVPYVSLSWALQWHKQMHYESMNPKACEKNPKMCDVEQEEEDDILKYVDVKRVDIQVSKEIENPIAQEFAQMINVVDPQYTVFESVVNENKLRVFEIESVTDHRDIIKDPFILNMIIESVAEIMVERFMYVQNVPQSSKIKKMVQEKEKGE